MDIIRRDYPDMPQPAGAFHHSVRFGNMLFIAGSSLAFSIMLAVVLAGIGLGGLAGGRWLARNPDAWRAAPALALLAGTLCIALYLGFGYVLPTGGLKDYDYLAFDWGVKYRF